MYPSETLERGSVYPYGIITKGVMYSYLGRRDLNSWTRVKTETKTGPTLNGDGDGRRGLKLLDEDRDEGATQDLRGL